MPPHYLCPCIPCPLHTCLPADDLRVVRELPLKAARDCAFSPGGQYFAAVNNNTVHVFCSYTCASLAVLRGHNGKVRPLARLRGACGWLLER